jgi:hypothetical protein
MPAITENEILEFLPSELPIIEYLKWYLELLVEH